jgi:hypothetical protein
MFETNARERIGTAPEARDKNGLMIEHVYWLNRLNDALKNYGISRDRLYTLSDNDRDGIVSAADLTVGIKKVIGFNELGSMDILNVVRAFEQESFSFSYFSKRLDCARATTHDA